MLVEIICQQSGQLWDFRQTNNFILEERGKKNMANTIALRKAYATMLDEVYKLASLTAVLDGPNELVKEGANANEILIPKMTMSGLANYNKQTGYVAGDVTLEYETKKCTYDRGRMFTVDAMDNIESAGVAFGRLSGEFFEDTGRSGT